MAGMRVVVVACDDDGNVDLADLDREDRRSTADRLAAIMVTYPSTHGVYEAGIAELCAKVHDAGGQVYVDGANLNALVGFAKPGRFGADVSHLNLHKTFCIPHGGGGPGVGPGGGARAPGARTCPATRWQPGDRHAVSAAAHGSAGILPISWAYLRMMGPDGLTPGDRRGGAGGQLRGGPAARALPGAVRRQQGPGRARVHPRPAADHQGDRRDASTTWRSG